MGAASRHRANLRQWRLPVAAALLVMVVAGGVVIGLRLLRFAFDKGHVVVEAALGETPERRVAQYFAALRDGDRERALSTWVIGENASEAMQQRRESVTDELLAIGADLSYTVEGIEWWRTCCEPGLIDDAAAAGMARLHVAVGGGAGGRQRRYTIDVITASPYWGTAGGDPVRHWLLRDVYRPGDRPLAFPWPSETPTPSAPLTLSETERNPSRWLTYTSTDWPLTLRYPPGWTVLEFVYADQSYGPVIRVSAGNRVLELVRRSKLPPGRSSAAGSASIGQMGALLYYQESSIGGQSSRRILLVPAGAGDTIAYASIELLGTEDDAEYLQIFLTVLSSVVFD